jgi:hypothetical protein
MGCGGLEVEDEAGVQVKIVALVEEPMLRPWPPSTSRTHLGGVQGIDGDVGGNLGETQVAARAMRRGW